MKIVVSFGRKLLCVYRSISSRQSRNIFCSPSSQVCFKVVMYYVPREFSRRKYPRFLSFRHNFVIFRPHTLLKGTFHSTLRNTKGQRTLFLDYRVLINAFHSFYVLYLVYFFNGNWLIWYLYLGTTFRPLKKEALEVLETETEKFLEAIRQLRRQSFVKSSFL